MTNSSSSKKSSSLFSFLEDRNTSILFFCALLAVQYGLQPIITTRCTPKGVSKSSVVISAEIVKMLISFLSIALESRETMAKIWSKFTLATSLKTAAFPAALYAIQNLCIQYGYAYLDSMTCNLLNQTKVSLSFVCF
jgi:UDP-sugar transporter A1/2/3